MTTRRIVGVLALLIALLGWVALGQKTKEGVYTYEHVRLTELLGWMWFGASLIVKCLMIGERRLPIVNTTALGCFVALNLDLVLFGEMTAPSHWPFICNVLIAFFVFGWPTIDLLDLAGAIGEREQITA